MMVHMDDEKPRYADPEMDEWLENVDDVTASIEGILDGTITDFEAFDKKQHLKQRSKEIRLEEQRAKHERILKMGRDGKGEGERYLWWCKKCFVEYGIDLEGNKCSRCSGPLMSQKERRADLMAKVDDFRAAKVKHQWRKDKWVHQLQGLGILVARHRL